MVTNGLCLWNSFCAKRNSSLCVTSQSEWTELPVYKYFPTVPCNAGLTTLHIWPVKWSVRHYQHMCFPFGDLYGHMKGGNAGPVLFCGENWRPRFSSHVLSASLRSMLSYSWQPATGRCLKAIFKSGRPHKEEATLIFSYNTPNNQNGWIGQQL
jgi:hypothetical protein